MGEFKVLVSIKRDKEVGLEGVAEDFDMPLLSEPTPHDILVRAGQYLNQEPFLESIRSEIGNDDFVYFDPTKPIILKCYRDGTPYPENGIIPYNSYKRRMPPIRV